jgi:DUF2075 family protein
MGEKGDDDGVGWWGTIDRFIEEPAPRLVADVSRSVSFLNLDVGESQTRAWNESVRIIKRECQRLAVTHPESGKWGIVLEYQLPRERGRRPDVVILTGCSLQVIEFKGRDVAEQADVDQLTAYARDLHEYHGASHDLRLNSILSLDDASIDRHRFEGVSIVGGRRLAECLGELADQPPCDPPAILDWLAADYAPLPSLVAAARLIFDHEPLPRIKRATSAGIPEALEALQKAAAQARSQNERHIALVSGVPGSGKTLVGLQFVYQTRFSDNEAARPAIFLSGNGPLVEVLQHALKSKVFVQDVHGFLVRYGGRGRARIPEEHIWVYDEAQRAWDAARVQGKRGHSLSEHEDFLRLGMRMPNWSMLVGLIGQGQEIHLGEEGGLKQWDDAVAKSGGDWIIHCPSRLASIFKGKDVRVNDALDLSTTLRAHLASDLHRWVDALLDGKLQVAAGFSEQLSKLAFKLYVTRDIEDAKQYATRRYSSEIDSRYGLLGSSKAKNLARYGINSSFQATRSFRPGPWYNDPPSSIKSCCQLIEVATEFSCQGLELEFPVVGWDTDLAWDGEGWLTKSGARSSARDPRQLRINSYRVLLTRARDGMAIFVPPLAELDPTFAALLAAGCRELKLFV